VAKNSYGLCAVPSRYMSYTVRILRREFHSGF